MLVTDECDVVRKSEVAVEYKTKSVALVTELSPRRWARHSQLEMTVLWDKELCAEPYTTCYHWASSHFIADYFMSSSRSEFNWSMATSIKPGSQEYEAESHLHISEQCTFSNRLENQLFVNVTELAPSNFLEDRPPLFFINCSDESLPSFGLQLN